MDQLKNRLLWCAFQAIIFIGVFGFLVEVVGLETPDGKIGLHIPAFIAALFSLGGTYLVSDVIDWSRRRRARRETLRSIKADHRRIQ